MKLFITISSLLLTIKTPINHRTIKMNFIGLFVRQNLLISSVTEGGFIELYKQILPRKDNI